MLEVPKRPPALYFRDDRKVVCGWWRRSRPFQGPRVPWIMARRPPPKVGPDQVEEEAQQRRTLEQSSDGDDHVPGSPPSFRLVGVDAPRHSQYSRTMHEIEGEVEPDQEQPKMPFAQGLVEHAPGYFRIPVVQSGEESEKDAAHDHAAELRHHHIRTAELPVERRGAEHNSRQAGDEKLKQK